MFDHLKWLTYDGLISVELPKLVFSNIKLLASHFTLSSVAFLHQEEQMSAESTLKKAGGNYL